MTGDDLESLPWLVKRPAPRHTDMRVTGTAVHFLPVHTRVPLKFGVEAVTYVTCARVQVSVEAPDGRRATGWGETPLSVQWVWPGTLPYEPRHRALKLFTELLGHAWANLPVFGHPMELGFEYLETVLPRLLEDFNSSQLAGVFGAGGNPESGIRMPWLAALVCASAYDLAVHDAYGRLHGRPTYETYSREFLPRDLSAFIQPAAAGVSFDGRFLPDFLRPTRTEVLPAWHLVGGLDPLSTDELTGKEPNDGYPVLLADWIRRDGLECLKVKLRGNDADWDYRRLVRVADIGLPVGVKHLTADFNCTVMDPAYVTAILDQLKRDHPEVYARLLYVEQPFPYELEEHRIDVHEVSRRCPLFLDESAHDWRMVRLGRELGWTGVALKTCKTQTGALLSAAWARAHGMQLMVQDLTNPMLAQVTHCLLAAHVGTILGVETNASQFYPEASRPESAIHPGLYERRGGVVDLSTIQGPGFGYREGEVTRELPEVSARFGQLAESRL